MMERGVQPKPSSTCDVDMSWCANPFAAWLLTQGAAIGDLSALVEGLAGRLLEAGLPLWRLVCLIRTTHPHVSGGNYEWRRDSGVREEFAPLLGRRQSLHHPESPLAAILEGTRANIRLRLDVSGIELDCPRLQKLRMEGATDYVAMRIPFSGDQSNAIAFVSDRPGGFTTSELKELYGMLPVLGHLLELYTQRYTAKALLDIYLGRYTGERVLNGLIERGDGEDIHAAIWFCDLRDSTHMAETMSRQDFLAILNEFFDCTAGAVLDHGGEVLRFIGDAALAIFPTGAVSTAVEWGCCDAESACRAALAAVADAQSRMAVLNRTRARKGEAPLHFGLGLHMGDVTYGNIGVPGRLEFTVIGAAANEAARLEGLCKALKTPVLISDEFEHCVQGELVSLGRHRLRGVSAAREVFTLRSAGVVGLDT